MCHNMFFTDFVGQYMYGGQPDAQEHTRLAVLYDEGVRMGSWGLFLHSLTGSTWFYYPCKLCFFLVTVRQVA